MECRPIPLIGQLWVLSGFDYAFDPDQDRPLLFAPFGETPLLNLPEAINDADLESAFHEAISRLFLQRYGPIALVQGIRAWDTIVEDMGTGKDIAAD